MSKKEENPINWGKVTELQNALDDFVAQERVNVKVFNPKELSARIKDLREIFDEDLGRIQYVVLSWAEANEIVDAHKGDTKEIAIQMLFKQLAPATHGLTVEDVRHMPYEVIARLINKLQTEGSFFQPKKNLSRGLPLTEKRNQLVT